MSVLEPADPTAVPASGMPAQRETVQGASVSIRDADETVGRAVVDHVRSHSMKCYWDFVECRWQCEGS